MQTRILKDGRMIVTSGENAPLIIKARDAKNLGQTDIESYCKNLFEYPDVDIAAPNGLCVEVRSLILRFFGLASLLSFLLLFLYYGIIPKGEFLIPLDTFLTSILLTGAFSLLTATLHELMHVWFGRSTTVTLSWKKSVMKTKLNHIWTWPRKYAIDALLAGIILDITLLLISSILYTSSGNTIFMCFATVLVIRIVWQFNPFSKRDISLALARYFDKPQGLYTSGNKKMLAIASLLFDLLYGSYFVYGVIIRMMNDLNSSGEGIRWF